MAKLLPLTGIVAAVLTPALAVTTSGPVLVILPLLAVVAGILAILERGRSNLILGVVLIVAGAVTAFLAIPGGVSGQDAQVAGSDDWAPWFAVLGGTFAILAIVGTRWGRLEPAWLGLGAVALAVVAVALFAWKVQSLGTPTLDAGIMYPAAILLLASGYPNLAVLREPETVAVHQETAAGEPAKPARARKTAAKR